MSSARRHLRHGPIAPAMDQTDQVCERCAQRGLYFPARTVGRMSRLLQDLITDRALARPEAPAVLSDGGSLTYGHLGARRNRPACKLSELVGLRCAPVPV